MPHLDVSTSTATVASASLVTVNPYVYLATLSRHDSYALLAAAAAFALAGAMMIQREAVEQGLARALERFGRRPRGRPRTRLPE